MADRDSEEMKRSIDAAQKESSMWNRSYQKARVALKSKDAEYSDGAACCVKFFKHCMHVFICVFCISLCLMVIMIVESQKVSNQLDSAYDKRVKSFSRYVASNPMYYGLNKVGDSIGVRDALNYYLRNDFTILDK